MSVRSVVKRAGVRVLTALGAARVGRWARGDSLLVLTYHNIVASSEDARRGEASLHLDRATFAEQLDLLRETHEVVSLSDVLNGSPWRGDRPRALITFDDAYLGAVTLGVAELVRRRMVATIFVSPGFVGGRTFWWDAVGAAHRGVIPDAVRQEALARHDGVDERVRAWAERSGIDLALPGAMQRCASLRELRAAGEAPGITFGAHSWSHPVMANLAPDQLRDELARPLDWLHASLDNVLPALAVPYGLSSTWVEYEARRVGYAAVFTGRRGWIPSRAATPFTLPRENVPAGLALETFMLRSAGVRA